MQARLPPRFWKALPYGTGHHIGIARRRKHDDLVLSVALAVFGLKGARRLSNLTHWERAPHLTILTISGRTAETPEKPPSIMVGQQTRQTTAATVRVTGPALRRIFRCKKETSGANENTALTVQQRSTLLVRHGPAPPRSM